MTRHFLSVLPVALSLMSAGLAQDGDWTTFSGNTLGHRFSPLKQIDRASVAAMKPLWVYQIDKTDKFESSPIVRESIMYI